MSASFSSSTYTYSVGPTEMFSATLDISTAIDYSIFLKYAGSFSANVTLYVNSDGLIRVLDRTIELNSGNTTALSQKFFGQSAVLSFYGGPGILTVTFLKQT